MPNVVLGVSGSIAAYRAADLVRDLMRAGLTVRVCLTDGAQKFVTPILFETLTGNPCLIDTFDEPERGRMAHIDWARQADLLLLAPATANTINKLAAGIADDMLSTLALAFDGALVVAPAMNPAMFEHPQTRESLARLASRATTIVQPVDGDVACGEHGQGKLASNSAIVAAAIEAIGVSHLLAGKTVLITSGPTREPIDNVRFLSNRSSGKMGAAIAKAALLMGAQTIVVSGHSSEPLPRGATVVLVETAEEMLAAALAHAKGADLIVGAAAVADYRPQTRVDGKLRRTEATMSLDLVRNPDVLAELAKVGRGVAIGFAAESLPDAQSARAKLAAKGIAAIAVNDVSRRDVGFDSDDNELKLYFATGDVEDCGKRSKLACALWLLERCAGLLKT